MDICRFPSSVESSNCDPYPETKQGPHWPTKLQAYCTNQLPVQSPGTHDKHSLHLVSWKIWYTRQKPVWFQKTSQHNGPPGESWKVRPKCLCTETAGNWSLRWFKKAYETTWQHGIVRDLHRIGLRGRLPVFVSEYLRDRRIRVIIGTTLSDEFYPEEGVPTGGVMAVTCFGLEINELPSGIAKDIFRALFVDDLAICVRGRSLDTIERHLQQVVNAIQEWATRNGFRFAAHKCKVIHFTAPRSKVPRLPAIRIGDTFLSVEDSTKFLGLWWDSHLSFKKHISVLNTQCREALNLLRVVAHLKWGGDRGTLLMLYRANIRSKLDYGCVVYGTASNTNLRQLDSIHNTGLRLALGAFCTSPVSSLYAETNEAHLEERRLKLSMNYYIKTRACIENLEHYALTNSTKPPEICMPPSQMGEEACPDPQHVL